MAKFAFLAVIAAFVTLLPVRLVAGDCITSELGHWSFDGTFEDISSHRRGLAEPAWDRSPVGGNVDLAWEDPAVDTYTGFLKIGNPGFLKVPRVDFHDKSFTFSLSLRLHGSMSERRILYADWSVRQQSFISTVRSDRRITIQLRNGRRELFANLISDSPVPLEVWVDVAFNWDRDLRILSIFIDRKLDKQKEVSSEILDIDLFKSSTAYYDLGSEADTASLPIKYYAPLDADVCNLRVFEGLDPNLKFHLPQVIEQ